MTRDDFKPNLEEVNREPTSSRFDRFPLCICYELFSELHDTGVTTRITFTADSDDARGIYGSTYGIDVKYLSQHTGQKIEFLVHPLNSGYLLRTTTQSFTAFLVRRVSERDAQYRGIPAARRPFISKYVAKPDYLNWRIRETIYTCTPKKTRGTV